MNTAIRTVLLVLAGNVGACQGAETPTRFTDGGADNPAESGRTYRWTFDDSATGALPPELINVLGDWQVEPDEGAPSAGNVLRQGGEFLDPDFPRVVVKDLTFSDLSLRVRCRLESGDTDRACGLVFRLADSDNYFITRANALESNLRLYRVVDGDRQQFASANLSVTAGEWHSLEATARGTDITVSWDGEPILSASDGTFARGKIGLWTKADAVTAFDDLEATAD